MEQCVEKLNGIFSIQKESEIVLVYLGYELHLRALNRLFSFY